MFRSFFRPRCPCDPEAKRWVEARLRWLNDQFPRNAFTGRPLIVPSPEYFPDPFIPTLPAVQGLAARIARWMDVDAARLRIEIDRLECGMTLVDGQGRSAPAGAAGLYEATDEVRTIVLSDAGLHAPADLVGTIAHEFAHERLLGEGRMHGDEFDNELLTDLTVVHLGLGVFLANSPRNWESQQDCWPESTLTRPEYMSPPMFGYALAHIAWHASDSKPHWERYLGPAVRTDFRQALRFLFESDDSSFKPGA